MDYPPKPMPNSEMGDDPTLEPFPIEHGMSSINRFMVVLSALGVTALLGYTGYRVLFLSPKSEKPQDTQYIEGPQTGVVARKKTKPASQPTTGSTADIGDESRGTDQSKADQDIQRMRETSVDSTQGNSKPIPEIIGDTSVTLKPGDNTQRTGVDYVYIPDRKLVIKKSIKATYYTDIGGTIRDKVAPLRSIQKSTLENVVVKATVENNGKVSKVQYLSGPKHLYKDVEKAALQWEFEPLKPHGLSGPTDITIAFPVPYGN
jgi:hypothetical protein